MKFALLLAAAAAATVPPSPRPPPPPAVAVTPENFPRAESDLNFAGLVKEGGLGKFAHRRDPIVLDHQGVTRINSRHALFGRGVRSRRRTRHDHAAGGQQALCLDADRR